MLVNFVSARHSARIDTTTGKSFSLSDQTKKILDGLEEDINVTAFYSERHYRRNLARDLLNEYAQQSSKFRLNFVDTYVKPGMVITYQIKQDGTVVFEQGDKREDVKNSQNEEQDFTSAILKLLSAEQKKIYFLEGHGERDIDGYDDNGYSNLKSIIEADNYLVDTLILAGRTFVPTDCSVLVIAGPEKPLMPQEEEVIAKYLAEGGKAVIMSDPAPSPSLSSLLARWGVKAHDDIILDAFGNTMLGAINIPVTVSYNNHPITAPMGRIMTFFPMARSVVPEENLRAGLKVVKLVETSPDSWGEIDTRALLEDRQFEYDESIDFKGPMNMAIAVALEEKAQSPTDPAQPPDNKRKEKRVLVAIGDSDFVTNKYLQEGNPDFFMNSVNWLTEAEGLISIRPKDQEMVTVRSLTGRQLRFVTYFSIFAIPLILMIIGGIVWLKRR